MNRPRLQRRDASLGLLVAFAAALPLSISAAEGFLFLALAWWLIRSGRPQWRRTLRDPLWWPVAAFAAAAALTVLWSVRPEATLHRMHRLLIPFGIFAVAQTVDRSDARAGMALGWFVGACCLRAVYDMFRVSRAMSEGADLFGLGNMRDPQMYLAAASVVLAAAPGSAWRSWRPFLVAAGGILGAGMLLHFKRGVWASLLVASGWLGMRTGRRRTLLILAAVAGAALLHPAVRERLLQLDDIRSGAAGGRKALWQDVAPVLLRAYPQGMGWCAVTHEDLAAHTPVLQSKLNHLHNNLLQVTVETGWLGLGCWLVWMGAGWWMLYRLGDRLGDPRGRALALGLWTAFTGLLVNGMVEYNFGDTEILMLFTLVLGIGAGLGRAPSPRAVDRQPAGGPPMVSRSQPSNPSREEARPSNWAS